MLIVAYGCLWMPMDAYGCLWMLMDADGCLWMLMDALLRDSRWILKGLTIQDLEEALVGVLLADVEVDDIAVAQLALLRLEEVKRGQTAPDVLLRLLAQRQHGRHVRLDRVLPGNAHQSLRQSANTNPRNAISAVPSQLTRWGVSDESALPGWIGGWKLEDERHLPQRLQRRSVQLVADADDGPGHHQRSLLLLLGARLDARLGRPTVAVLQHAHQVIDRRLNPSQIPNKLDI